MKQCHDCVSNPCYNNENLSDKTMNCNNSRKNIIEQSMQEYKKPEIAKIAKNSALVESEGYCKDIRLIEIMKFAEKCNYSKLGLAFCIGLKEEAKIVAEILENHGFKIISAACKFSNIDKTELGLEDKDKISQNNFESICNPIGQAMLFNEEKTDLNIVIGLCVGHDSLFFKYSDAPATVFAVKDRVLGHNPLAAVYTSNFYYNKKLFPKYE